METVSPYRAGAVNLPQSLPGNKMKPGTPAMVLSGLFLLGSVLMWNLGMATISITFTIMGVVVNVLPRERVEAFLEAG